MEVEPTNLAKALTTKTMALTPEEKKRVVIESMYYNNETGYRNIKETWKAAKLVYNSIKENDVREWRARAEAQKEKVSGYNSFIPSKPYEEFQIDLWFFAKEGEQEPKTEVEKIDEEAKEASAARLR